MLNSEGAAAVRWLRMSANLTQVELARRSGVSVRSIRSMENGEVSRPHRSTLVALADAARLDAAHTAAFVRAWSGISAFTTFTELSASDLDIEAYLAEHNVRDQIDQRILSEFRHLTVGADRTTSWQHFDTLIEATRQGVDTYCALILGDQSFDVRLMEVTETRGCRLVSKTVIPGHNLSALEFELGRELDAGETHLLHFAYRSRGDQRPTDPELAAVWDGLSATDGVSSGSRRPVGQILVEVVFQGCRPTGIWTIDCLADGSIHKGDPVQLDAHDSVHLHQRSLDPGAGAGFYWEW